MRVKSSQENKTLSEKVGNVTIPIYSSQNGEYEVYTVAWYEDGKRRRKVFADLKKARGRPVGSREDRKPRR